ncbi:UNVERIFIED_CONTAM: hypothetical protein RF653_03350 [Kocuria sp. CPCC 205316]|uniref:hypothetical protein n=1 Tax=Kocuria TaxID=57493 RepID=UPI0036DA6C72
MPVAVGLLHGCLVLCVAGSTAAHGWMAVGGGHGAGWSLAMAVMAVLCAFCVVGLMRRPLAVAPVRMAMVMALTMALLHVLMIPLMAGAAGRATHHHAHHGGGGPGAAPVASSAGGADLSAMMLVIVLELTAGGLAAARLRRR